MTDSGTAFVGATVHVFDERGDSIIVYDESEGYVPSEGEIIRRSCVPCSSKNSDLMDQGVSRRVTGIESEFRESPDGPSDSNTITQLVYVHTEERNDG